MRRGYFGIGIENGKNTMNIGTLWRSAHNFGADFMFVIGKRYDRQASDTTKAWRSIPLYNHETFDSFYAALPYDCRLIGIEFPHDSAVALPTFCHPERCVYILGAEDHGLSKHALSKCHGIVFIPSLMCLNVSVSGSIVMYDRMSKSPHP